MIKKIGIGLMCLLFVIAFFAKKISVVESSLFWTLINVSFLIAIIMYGWDKKKLPIIKSCAKIIVCVAMAAIAAWVLHRFSNNKGEMKLLLWYSIFVCSHEIAPHLKCWISKRSKRKRSEIMDRKIFDLFRESIVANEATAWIEVRRLRSIFETRHQELFQGLVIATREEAIGKGFSTVSKVLNAIENCLDLRGIDPGHGLGHLGVDYLHALVLAGDIDADPGQIYVGFVGAVLHDILGCSIVPRYAESQRVIRHAEAGGLLFMEIAKEIGISENEAVLVFYAIAAHTHYLKPVMVKCQDGIEREIRPYTDTVDDLPIMSIWMTRWTDRLDVNGPRFVGRHFLTMAEQHEDYSSTGKFYTVKFADHMRSLLRSLEKIKEAGGAMTMREHLNMFATSQNNQGPYGRFDCGEMAEIRDDYKKRLFRIIDSFDDQISQDDGLFIVLEWTKWLSEKIEPSEAGRTAAVKIQKMFLELPDDIRFSWYNVMKVTLYEYEGWGKDMRRRISRLPEEFFTLPILGDVRQLI